MEEEIDHLCKLCFHAILCYEDRGNHLPTQQAQLEETFMLEEQTEQTTNTSVETLSQKKRLFWLTVLPGLCSIGILALLVLLPGSSFLDKLRWLVSGIYGQMPGHFFYPGGESLPLCARYTGIFLGFIVTLFTLYGSRRGRAQQLPRWPIILLLIGGGLAMAIDGFNSLLLDLRLPHLYQPDNLLRLGTGLAMGLAVAALTLPMLNRLFWCEFNEQRSIPSWRALPLLLPVLVLSFFAVASQNALLLYPLALLSTAGVLIVVSSINLIVVVAIAKRDQTFLHYHELLPFFSIAFLFAIGELLLLAQLKLLLFHAIGM